LWFAIVYLLRVPPRLIHRVAYFAGDAEKDFSSFADWPALTSNVGQPYITLRATSTREALAEENAVSFVSSTLRSRYYYWWLCSFLFG